MPEETQFTIGAEASCSDGPCGEISRVVIDPIARAVTHLVVEPTHRSGLGRLVPLDLVDATAGEIRLRCTRAEFDELEHAEETRFLPGMGGFGAYGPGQAVSWPYFGLVSDPGGGGLDMGLGLGNASLPVISDTLPAGEVAVRRGDPVHATDGEIGQVQGLVIDTGDHHVTHVLLQEGHLWGRKQVTIPIGAVTGVDDGIQLNLTKQQVQDLPPLEISG